MSFCLDDFFHARLILFACSFEFIDLLIVLHELACFGFLSWWEVDPLVPTILFFLKFMESPFPKPKKKKNYELEFVSLTPNYFLF